MRCVQINPAMSKAFQLAGQSYISAGDNDSAAEVLAQGYKAAAGRGDRMPMKAMGDLLTKIGRPVPEVAGAKSTGGTPGGPGGFVCQRTGRPGTKMSRPPFKGAVGEWIAANISKETFDDWIAQGTKVINELRLDLSRDEDDAVYDAHMREFLGIDDELYERLTGARPVRP
jgi:Fe-S cluster biosynthesis and repair protein YggX